MTENPFAWYEPRSRVAGDVERGVARPDCELELRLFSALLILLPPFDFLDLDFLESLGLSEPLVCMLSTSSSSTGISDGSISDNGGRKDCLLSASSMRRKAVTAVQPEWILPSDSSHILERRESTLWKVSLRMSGIVLFGEARRESSKYWRAVSKSWRVKECKDGAPRESGHHTTRQHACQRVRQRWQRNPDHERPRSRPQRNENLPYIVLYLCPPTRQPDMHCFVQSGSSGPKFLQRQRERSQDQTVQYSVSVDTINCGDQLGPRIG
jgi:hypothetical protein